MKPIRLLVDMPSHGVFTIGGRMGVGPIEEQVETTADGLRRVEFKGETRDDYVMARAYVPPQYQDYLRRERRLSADDHVWCVARVKDNVKSLAPFMASDDPHWGEK
ncbi:hypothetical protein [Paraburkholderia sp. 2C]